VRHRPVRLPRPQGRRPHRDVRRARDRPRLSAGKAVMPDLDFFWDPV
jgi:hypothetical protein